MAVSGKKNARKYLGKDKRGMDCALILFDDNDSTW